MRISYIAESTLQDLDKLKREIDNSKNERILKQHNQRYSALEHEALNTSLYIECPEYTHSSRRRLDRDAKRLLRRLNTAWWYCTDNIDKDTLTPRDVEVIQSIIVPEGKVGLRQHDVTIAVPHEVATPRYEDVQKLMAELFKETNELASTTHPVELAAYLHLHLLWIHPFSDGNGRSSRLVQNFLLHRAGYCPAIVRPHERWLYFWLLDEAKKGIIRNETSYQRPFYEFIATKVHEGLEKVLSR